MKVVTQESRAKPIMAHQVRLGSCYRWVREDGSERSGVYLSVYHDDPTWLRLVDLSDSLGATYIMQKSNEKPRFIEVEAEVHII